tara:strand:- start:2475 stop:2816 length:342 start_codon:yes stop_codon:yes gene_type:complete
MYKQQFKLGKEAAPAKQIQGNNKGKNAGKFSGDGGQLFDADGDGDTVFNDSNNDGTMLSRGLNAAKKAYNKGAASSDRKAGKAKSTQEGINDKFKSDFKEKGFIQAVKDNFKF